MASPLLDRVKVQAEVLVPVLRAFRAAFGEEEANRVAWQALAEWRGDVVRNLRVEIDVDDLPAPGVERWSKLTTAGMPMIGDAIDVEWQGMSETNVDFDITGCRFAEFFRSLGEPDLGFALLCSMDYTSAEIDGGGDVTLDRATTIMQGGDRCTFRYQLKQAGLPST
jgi:hypothetical protein